LGCAKENEEEGGGRGREERTEERTGDLASFSFLLFGYFLTGGGVTFLTVF
jgi:hypothetical protein